MAGTSFNGEISRFDLTRFMAPVPLIGSFTINPSPVTAGNSLILTAANVVALNPNDTITIRLREHQRRQRATSGIDSLLG
jgi:hypothetical protein